MTSLEIRKEIEAKTAEVRKFIDDKDLDNSKKANEELRGLKDSLKIAEELEADEKRALESQEEARKLEVEEAEQRKDEVKVETVEKKDITPDEARSFAQYIRGEERALSVGNSGGVIPTTIANKIIEKVHDLSPIYSMATVYNVAGKLVLPVYDESTSSINAAYMDEFTELTEGTGSFTTISLDSFIVGVLAKVSKSLINKSDFDVTNFVINEIAKSIARFIDKECLVGTTSKINGALSSTNTMTSSTVGAVVADDIISLEAMLPDLYVANGVFIMAKATRTALKKLKDGQGNYLLQRDFQNTSKYQLLGHDVYISENMPALATGNNAILFGDLSGYVIKLSKNLETTILNEKYATQYAVGACAYMEIDGDIQDNSKLAVMEIK